MHTPVRKNTEKERCERQQREQRRRPLYSSDEVLGYRTVEQMRTQKSVIETSLQPYTVYVVLKPSDFYLETRANGALTGTDIIECVEQGKGGI